LAAYQARMEMQQERIEYMEEENRHLENLSLQMPPTKNDKTVVIPSNHFYCRPPKGINTTPSEQMMGDALHVFPAKSSKCRIREMMVAIVKSNPSNKFTEEVLGALGITSPTKRPRDIRPPGRPGLRLELYEEANEDQETYVYLYRQDAPYEVAVA